jgi:organic radical activating enzyme
LLLFDRETGRNVLCDGPEFTGLRQRCARVVQFGITNRCNLACEFSSRDLTMASSWTAPSAFAFLSDLAERGVLEAAFGGGEPFVFPGFVELVERLHAETPLGVNITTNGLKLRPAVLDACAPPGPTSRTGSAPTCHNADLLRADGFER